MSDLELVLDRLYKLPKYSIGKLYINGKYFCDTLEDVDRGLDCSMSEYDIRSKKVKGETAIPTGRYEITLSVQSPRFKGKSSYKFCNGYLPRLIDVKGYEGVLIHIGNTKDDTDGCILVGFNKSKGMVLDSTKTFSKLYSVLKSAVSSGKRIYITIK